MEPTSTAQLEPVLEPIQPAVDEPDPRREDQEIAAFERMPALGLSDRVPGLNKDYLAPILSQIVDTYWQRMRDRIRMWDEIEDAYHLIASTRHQGYRPNSNKLVSILTKKHVNNVASMILGTIRSMRPWVQIEVAGAESDDEETRRLLDIADATENFFESYRDVMRLGSHFRRLIPRAVRLGTSIQLIDWSSSEVGRYIRIGKKGERKTVTRGFIKWRCVRNQDFIVWPLDLPPDDLEHATVVGHRVKQPEYEFRAFCEKLKIPKADVDEICAVKGTTDEEESGSSVAALVRMKIERSNSNPLGDPVEYTKLHVRLPVREGGDAIPVELLFHPGKRKIFWVQQESRPRGRHPYFAFTYWREDDSFWGTGVGEEVRWQQAAGSGMKNLYMDNLQTSAHHVRIVKSGSMAAENAHYVSPGEVIEADDTEKDIRFESLGSELTLIENALSLNDYEAQEVTQDRSILAGGADQTLKSGAGASMYQQLQANAQKKFGMSDSDLRDDISDALMWCLELIQQYAPDGLFYRKLNAKEAGLMEEARLRLPKDDDLRAFLRLSVKAPSAGSNRDVQQQNIMLVFNLTTQFFEGLQMLQPAFAANPTGFQDTLERFARILFTLYQRMLEIHDIQGVSAPDIGPPTPEQERTNMALQQLQQCQQMLEQTTMQRDSLMQMMGGGPPGGGGMGGPGAMGGGGPGGQGGPSGPGGPPMRGPGPR